MKSNIKQIVNFVTHKFKRYSLANKFLLKRNFLILSSIIILIPFQNCSNSGKFKDLDSSTMPSTVNSSSYNMHTITAVAKDANGNTKTTSIQVAVPK